MVFGRKAVDWSVWRRAYAYKPWKLQDGRWVWLEWVEITGYVANREIEPRTHYNVRVFGTGFVVRLVDDTPNRR